MKDRSFKRNVKWQVGSSAGQAFFSGLVLLLVGRELGAAGFGVFSVIMGFVYVGNSLLEPRMQDVAARQFWDFNSNPGERIHHSRSFIDLFVFEAAGKFIPCIFLIALAPLLARIGNLPAEAHEMIVVAALGVYLSRLGNGLSVGFLRALGRTDIYAFCVVGELFARLVLTLFLVAFFQLTVLRCILILCITGTVSNVIQWIFSVNHFGSIGSEFRRWTLGAATGRMKQHRRLLLSNLGLSVSDLMNKDLDITLLSPLMPADQIGIYKMAKSITMLTWRAVDPFYLSLMPEISRLVATGELLRVRRLLTKSALGLLGLAIAISISTYVLLLQLGTMFLGPAFSGTLHLLPWMLIGIVISAPLVWGHPLSVALNRADITFGGSLLGSVLGLFAFVGLAPSYGTVGAAIAWTMTFPFLFMFSAGTSYYLLLRRMRSKE